MQSAFDFSYFGSKSSALHVCKRSVGRRGLEWGCGAFLEKPGQDCGGDEEVERGFRRIGEGVPVKEGA